MIAVFGGVTKIFDELDKINNVYYGKDNKPYQNLRIIH